MDAIQLLEEMGEVPPADDATIDAAIEVVLAAAFQEKDPSLLVSPTKERCHRRRAALGGAVLAATAAAVLALVVLLPFAGSTGSPPGGRTGIRPGHHAPSVLTAQMVRLISSQSSAALADSGTAVETMTNTVGSAIQGEPATIDITFSGQNVNYLIVGNGNGAAGVENRVVDGQLYLYIKGPDLQMHWYHDTSPNAAATMSYPDPRTLLQGVSPSANLENLGQELVGGVELTHLRAMTPGPIGKLGIPDVSSTVTSFDVWVDSANIVRQMAVSSSAGGTGFVCAAAPGAASSSSGLSPTVTIPPTDRLFTLPDGKHVPPGTVCGPLRTMQTGSTLDVQFANLGDPETVATPSGAVDQQGLG